MAVKRPRRRGGVAIDMTPYVDVIMLILTFFMLTAQFKAELAEDIKIKLPESGNDTTKLPERNIMTILVSSDNDIFVDVDNQKVKQEVFGDILGLAAYHPDSTTQPGYRKPNWGKKEGSNVERKLVEYKNREAFKKLLIDLRLASKSSVGKDLRIVVKGDAESDLGTVQNLMDMLKETKNTRFALVTDMDKGDQQKK